MELVGNMATIRVADRQGEYPLQGGAGRHKSASAFQNSSHLYNNGMPAPTPPAPSALLPLREYEQLQEDIRDLAVVAGRRKEPIIRFDRLKKRSER